MNKKIKIIELWNIVAQVEDIEKLPKKIKYHEDIYELQPLSRDYYCNREDDYLTNRVDDKPLNSFLNDTIEILEDNTEEEDNAEEIEEIKGWGLATDYKDFETINHTLDRFGNKINEIIRVYNKLRKEKE